MQRFLNVLSVLFIIVISANIFGVNNKFGYTLRSVTSYSYPTEDDTKLKYVSGDSAISLNASLSEIILPFPVLDSYEENGFIFIKTTENAIITAPMGCTVYRDKNKITIIKSNLKCELYNIGISGIKDSQELKRGDVIGSIQGDIIKFKIYLNNKLVSYEKVKKFL